MKWSCDERDRKQCRNSHGCHCREITALREQIDSQPQFDVAPLKRALTYAGIASPVNQETLAFNWAEYAQKIVRYVDGLRARPRS